MLYSSAIAFAFLVAARLAQAAPTTTLPASAVIIIYPHMQVHTLTKFERVIRLCQLLVSFLVLLTVKWSSMTEKEVVCTTNPQFSRPITSK
jgi:hypothetical protein